MNIKNVLFIAATLFIVTANANAATEYSNASHSGFSLGFKSSSQAVKHEVNTQAKESNSEYQAKNLVLGFNDTAKVSVKEGNVIAQKAVKDKNTRDVNKVADSFNIGFDS